VERLGRRHGRGVFACASTIYLTGERASGYNLNMRSKRTVAQRIALALLRFAEALALRAHGWSRDRSFGQDTWASRGERDLLLHDRAVVSMKRRLSWGASAGLRCLP
jgi:hypothetical protein